MGNTERAATQHRSSVCICRKMATPVQNLAKYAALKPWLRVKHFQGDKVLSRVPEHYKKFYYEWRCVPKTPVHYIPEDGNYKLTEDGQVQVVQNVPLPLKFPKEANEGLWGGEGILKGFRKKHTTKRRFPHYWVPTIKKTVVYSEILDRYMRISVTERALKLIDQHYGLDAYILETPPADLVSELAVKLRREMLLTLVNEACYPEDTAKKNEILEKYKNHIIPEEEAEWYGLSLHEANIKQRKMEEADKVPKPLKDLFRQEFLQYLQENKDNPETTTEDKKGSTYDYPSGWLSTLNPFGKK